MDDRVFSYSIDRDGAVASVSDAWLEFARENRAEELTRDYVVGRPLYGFIAGRETHLLYEGLFQRVRTRAETVELPFRCDSPDRFRFMRLILTPGPRDSIECDSRLVREQQRPFYSVLDRAFPRSRASLLMCSLCKRIYAFESHWLELEEAIRQLDLFESADLPELQYTICDDCASADRRNGGGTAA